MTPLAAKLARRIAATGPITVAEFMTSALSDPAHGYYSSAHCGDRGLLGVGGDFTTAPEISQMFGELIGAWLVDCWEGLGRPSPIRLIELGPGRGTLMADALRVARGVPGWGNAIDLHLIEISPAMRREQERTLGVFSPRWHHALATVPEGPMLLIANEFFDALPIRQLVGCSGRWHERLVAWSPAEGFFFTASPFPSPLGGLVVPGIDASDGAVFELSPTSLGVVSSIGRRLVKSGGAALLIDYGRVQSATGETMQAVSRHRTVPIFTNPGEADLSAHVDFTMLAQAAREAGATISGPITQREFLLGLGMKDRADFLARGASARQSADLYAALDRLAGPSGMGTLFKALALSAPGQGPVDGTG